MTRFRSEPLQYGSFLVYAPRPKTEAETKAKKFLLALKGDRLIGTARVRATEYAACRLSEELDAGHADQFDSFFSPDAVLVPVPRSAPSRGDIVWAPHSLANALVDQGLGGTVELLLTRQQPIRKSAGAKSRPRPQEHYESLEVAHRVSVAAPSRIILVDDVVTRGSTLLGASWRLREAFPNATVAGFAGVRTMSRGFGDEIVQPVVGTITLSRNRLSRDP